MKRLLTTMLIMVTLLLLSGCGENANTTNTNDTQITESTTENTTTTTSPSTTTSQVDTKSIEEDVLVMLDYLTKAEEIYSRTDTIVKEYNDEVISVEETIKKLKEEQTNMAELISNASATEWKSARYRNMRKQELSSVLNNMSIFFESSISALEQNNNTLIIKANSYLTSYCNSSLSLYNNVSKDDENNY